MKNKRYVSRLAVLAASVLVLALSACGGGGGSGSSAASGSPAAISGTVADGYVTGAAVTVYSDAAMTQQIGSGSTGATGNFSITLTVDTVPPIIYIKTEGGIDTSTGLSAPTMFFAGSYTAGTLNVTPITTEVMKAYQNNPSSGLDAALSSVAGALGISTADATADVVTDATAQSAMYQVLSTGSTGGTLPDGAYTVSVVFVEYNDVASRVITGVDSGVSPLSSLVKTWSTPVTVTNGLLSGRADNGDPVSGVVRGSTIVMAHSSGTNGVVMAGEINLGAASGTFTRTTTGNQATGLFLATFTPASITPSQTANLFSALGNIFRGPHYFAAADFLPAGAYPLNQDALLNFGEITITPGSLDGSGFAFTGFTDYGLTGPAASTTTMWSAGAGSASFLAGRIYAFSQPVTAGGGTLTIYVVGAVGNRNCIGFVADSASGNKIAKIVRITLVRDTNIAPVFQANTRYWRYEATAAPYFLNQTRLSLVPGGAVLNSKSDSGGGGIWLAYAHNSVVPPALSGIGYGAYAPNSKNVVFVGGTIMQEKIADFTATSMGSNDNIQALNLYEGGAMSGTQIFGGTTCGPTNSTPCSDFPATNVFFMRRDGTTPPDFAGVVNFVSRGLYATDYSNVAAYLSRAYSYGTLAIDTAAGSATLSYTNGAGESGTCPLVLTKLTDPANPGVFSGLVWFAGSLTSGGYIDIFWPIGGRIATYVVSDSPTGTIQQVGEAYLTY